MTSQVSVAVKGVTVDTGPEPIEFELLLEGIRRRYGYDFQRYAPDSLRRRVHTYMRTQRIATISQLQDRVLHDPCAMERLFVELTVGVTAMFRDPLFFRSFREKVVPILRTYPFVRIWDAGCATGEEAYSLAILLSEEGLYERSRIYATDVNERALDQAHKGLIPLRKMREYTRNYIEAGGRAGFSDYYHVDHAGGRLDPRLADNIVFAQHDLVSSGSFNEFNVIVCRNVLIYFDPTLQENVSELFHSSLVRLGVLALGPRETIRTSKAGRRYAALDPVQKIFKRLD